jgi:pimeloyl-ACP methyl ester carboxylesterase
LSAGARIAGWRKENKMSVQRIPLVLVPCFSGAPWDTSAFPKWKDRIMVTGQLPNAESIDRYADIVDEWAAGLPEYVLVGDSFGASIALALAERRPRGLRALVMSGGYAYAHVTPYTRMRVTAGKLLGQTGYPISVRFHVMSLGSKFDPPGTQEELRDIFLLHSDAGTFVRRAELTLGADMRPGLSRVNVPTLIITPEDDRLIGPASAAELIHGIPDAEEVVLPGTGHLLRFTHEAAYAQAAEGFLTRRLALATAGSASRDLATAQTEGG